MLCCHDALVLRVLMRLVVCVTLSAVLLPVALAQAVSLSPGNPGASNPQVSLNPAGRYVITWSAARVPGSFIVATGTLPALPREAFSVGEANTVAPTAAVSNGGAFALAWYQRVGYVKSSVQALMGSIGTSGGALQTLEGAAFVTSDSQPAIAFGSADRPLIGWTQDGAGTDHASVLLSTGGIGGGFAPAQPVFSEPSRASLAGTQIAVDGAGQPTVVWDRGGVICNGHLTAHAARSCKPTSERVYAANGDESGRLGPVQHFGAGCAEPRLVEAPSGAAAIVMVCNRRGDIAIEVAQRSAGGSFRRPRVIPGRLADDFEPAVTLAPSGRLTIGYLHRRSLNKPHEGDESTRVEVASGQLGTRAMRGPRSVALSQCRPASGGAHRAGRATLPRHGAEPLRSLGGVTYPRRPHARRLRGPRASRRSRSNRTTSIQRTGPRRLGRPAHWYRGGDIHRGHPVARMAGSVELTDLERDLLECAADAGETTTTLHEEMLECPPDRLKVESTLRGLVGRGLMTTNRGVYVGERTYEDDWWDVTPEGWAALGLRPHEGRVTSWMNPAKGPFRRTR